MNKWDGQAAHHQNKSDDAHLAGARNHQVQRVGPSARNIRITQKRHCRVNESLSTSRPFEKM